jgi:hypothetical protein
MVVSDVYEKATNEACFPAEKMITVYVVNTKILYRSFHAT